MSLIGDRCHECDLDLRRSLGYSMPCGDLLCAKHHPRGCSCETARLLDAAPQEQRHALRLHLVMGYRLPPEIPCPVVGEARQRGHVCNCLTAEQIGTLAQ